MTSKELHLMPRRCSKSVTAERTDMRGTTINTIPLRRQRFVGGVVMFVLQTLLSFSLKRIKGHAVEDRDRAGNLDVDMSSVAGIRQIGEVKGYAQTRHQKSCCSNRYPSKGSALSL